jgi:SEC-C motif-containing protein
MRLQPPENGAPAACRRPRRAGKIVLMHQATCPCGSTLPYAACCGRYHAGPLRLQAPDAVSLMRSRYCAFTLGLTDYLLDTWHPSTRPDSIAADPPGLKWLGLEVRRHAVQGHGHAVVEFVARNRLNGRAVRLHETSRFVHEVGRWLYVDGDHGP